MQEAAGIWRRGIRNEDADFSSFVQVFGSGDGSTTSFPGHGPGPQIEGASGASLIAQVVKNLPAMQETGVRFLGQEDPLEEEMATHSSILAWRIPWTEEPGRL